MPKVSWGLQIIKAKRAGVVFMSWQLWSVRDAENHLKKSQPKSEPTQCPTNKQRLSGQKNIGWPHESSKYYIPANDVHILVKNNFAEESFWNPATKGKSDANFFLKLHFLGMSWLLPEHNVRFAYRAQGQCLPRPLSKWICQIGTPPGGHSSLNLPWVENLQENSTGEKKLGWSSCQWKRQDERSHHLPVRPQDYLLIAWWRMFQEINHIILRLRRLQVGWTLGL